MKRSARCCLASRQGRRLAPTPLHTLRKEFGSQIHARYGLLAAQRSTASRRHRGDRAHYIENSSDRSWASATC